jgi:hypothetical protein
LVPAVPFPVYHTSPTRSIALCLPNSTLILLVCGTPKPGLDGGESRLWRRDRTSPPDQRVHVRQKLQVDSTLPYTVVSAAYKASTIHCCQRSLQSKHHTLLSAQPTKQARSPSKPEHDLLQTSLEQRRRPVYLLPLRCISSCTLGKHSSLACSRHNSWVHWDPAEYLAAPRIVTEF